MGRIASLLCLIVGVIVLLACAHTAAATSVIYVDPLMGVDNSTCGIVANQPCKTIQEALSFNPIEVRLLPGNYSGTGNVGLSFSSSVNIIALGPVYLSGGVNSWTIQSNLTVAGVRFVGAATAVQVTAGTSQFVGCSFLNNVQGNCNLHCSLLVSLFACL